MVLASSRQLSYVTRSFVVVLKTLGQRGPFTWTLIKPSHLHMYMYVDYEVSKQPSLQYSSPQRQASHCALP